MPAVLREQIVVAADSFDPRSALQREGDILFRVTVGVPPRNNVVPLDYHKRKHRNKRKGKNPDAHPFHERIAFSLNHYVPPWKNVPPPPCGEHSCHLLYNKTPIL